MLNDSSDLEFLKKYSEKKQHEIIAFLMKNIINRVTNSRTEGVYIIKNSDDFISTPTDLGDDYNDYVWRCKKCNVIGHDIEEVTIQEHLESHHPELLQEETVS